MRLQMENTITNEKNKKIISLIKDKLGIEIKK